VTHFASPRVPLDAPGSTHSISLLLQLKDLKNESKLKFTLVAGSTGRGMTTGMRCLYTRLHKKITLELNNNSQQ